MDPFEDTLRRLREAFGAGRTRPAEFRTEQLQALSRFLQDNKKLLQDALAQDLHKVGRGEGRGRGEGGVGQPERRPRVQELPISPTPSFVHLLWFILHSLTCVLLSSSPPSTCWV